MGEMCMTTVFFANMVGRGAILDMCCVVGVTVKYLLIFLMVAVRGGKRLLRQLWKRVFGTTSREVLMVIL